MAGELSKALRLVQRLPFVFRTSGARLSSFFILPLNPEIYSVQFPTRGSVHQTMDGNFENFFGMGLGKVTIRGTFGFQPRPQYGLAGIPLPGQAQLKYLEAMFTAFFREYQATISLNDGTWDFMDLSDAHFFKVRIMSFEYERSTAHQFLHRYSMHMLVLRDYLAEKALAALPEDEILSKLSGEAGIFAGMIGAVGNLALSSNPTDTVLRSVGIAAQPIINSMLGSVRPIP